MVNKYQIKLIQTAARAAGLRNGDQDERYYMVLRQFKTKNGYPVTSCKELLGPQIDHFLAICEAYGWRYPGKGETFYRDKAAEVNGTNITFAQRQVIQYLAGDLGLSGGIGKQCLEQFISRMTKGRTKELCLLTRREAYNIIEALKAQLERHNERTYENCKDIQSNYTEVIPNGQEVQKQPAPF